MIANKLLFRSLKLEDLFHLCTLPSVVWYEISSSTFTQNHLPIDKGTFISGILDIFKLFRNSLHEYFERVPIHSQMPFPQNLSSASKGMTNEICNKEGNCLSYLILPYSLGSHDELCETNEQCKQNNWHVVGTAAPNCTVVERKGGINLIQFIKQTKKGTEIISLCSLAWFFFIWMKNQRGKIEIMYLIWPPD
jgi:hypothetical protein